MSNQWNRKAYGKENGMFPIVLVLLLLAVLLWFFGGMFVAFCLSFLFTFLGLFMFEEVFSLFVPKRAAIEWWKSVPTVIVCAVALYFLEEWQFGATGFGVALGFGGIIIVMIVMSGDEEAEAGN